MTEPWRVGCGSADITGEPWDAGMMGYGMPFQRTAGLHLRPEELLRTATHTHAGPGGYSGYRMYNRTNKGVRRHT